MTLKNLLLGRFGKRGELDGGITLSSSLSVVEKYSQLRDIVERTILPRHIELVNSKGSLSVTVAEKLVLRISGDIQGTEKFEQLFTAKKPSDLSDEIKVGLAGFLANNDDCQVSFAEVEDDFTIKGGISAARITPIAPAPKVRVLTRTGTSDMPLKFLTKAHEVVRKARYFTGLIPDSVSGQLNAYSRVEPTEFAGIKAIHQKLSPALGQNLLFMVIAEGEKPDSFAIATNGDQGVVIELDRQKIGRICQTWREVAPSTK